MQDHPLPEPLTSPLLAVAEDQGIRHGFFSRRGGVSQGIYRGLNVGIGSNDEREKVQENRRRVSNWFGLSPERLSTVHQVHSPDVVVVDQKLARGSARATCQARRWK